LILALNECLEAVLYMQACLINKKKVINCVKVSKI
jgi:hypothetical protein